MYRTDPYPRIASLCLLLVGVWASSGCAKNQASRDSDGGSAASTATSSTIPALDSSVQDSIFAYLTSIDQAAFTNSFDQLDEKTFTRYTRTEQFDGENFLIAFEERVIRHSGSATRREFDLIDHDSAGVFDYGYLRRFVSDSEISQDPMDFARRIVPEDPAYMSPRNRDAYAYRPLPDTLMGDVSARAIEIRARPELGDGQSIRLVRLYVDRDLDRLIAMYVERIDQAMWYREESLFYLHIRGTSDDRWMPYNTRFETRITIPFRSAQRFRTASTYYAYEVVGSSS